MQGFLLASFVVVLPDSPTMPNNDPVRYPIGKFYRNRDWLDLYRDGFWGNIGYHMANIPPGSLIYLIRCQSSLTSMYLAIYQDMIGVTMCTPRKLDEVMEPLNA